MFILREIFFRSVTNTTKTEQAGLAWSILAFPHTVFVKVVILRKKTHILIEWALERRHERMENENKICNDTPMAAKSYKYEHCSTGQIDMYLQIGG